MATLTRTVEPPVEPLTAAEVRAHTVIDDTSQDDLLDLYITGARKYFEHLTNRQLITATYTLELDAFPSVINLPRSPISSVTSVVYLDTAGANQTLTSGTDYQTALSSEPGRIAEEPGTSWPSTETDRMNVVTVTYVAGYGAAASDVPTDIKNALRLLVAHQYEHRESLLVGGTVGKTLMVIPIMAVDSIIALYRIDDFGWCLSEQ